MCAAECMSSPCLFCQIVPHFLEPVTSGLGSPPTDILFLRRLVYDFTDFVEEHPGGASSIEDIGGKDGTGAFQAIHSPAMLEDFTPIGKFSPL